MRKTARQIRQLKNQRPMVLLSAYDAIWARLAETAGADVLLVGDSVGIEVLGFGSVIPVTLDMLLHHLKAVVRATTSALVVADMPLGDYGVSKEETIRHAIRLIKDGGAGAIKMAGGAELAETVHALTSIGIPVMGHIGVNSSHAALGEIGPVLGTSHDERQQLRSDAQSLEQAGAFSLIAKCIVPRVAQELTRECSIPVISIGSGKTDGIGANTIDLVGLSRTAPWFSLRQVEGETWLGEALQRFIRGVADGTVEAVGWKETDS